MDALSRYSVLDNQSGAPVQPGEWVWGGWRKAFNHDLRCYAALKVIPITAFPNQELREEFAREVQIAARIRHRSLAAVFPLEMISDSYLYAMEFCDGETLTDRILGSGCLETLDALDIAKQIAAGLEAASSAGLIHRDISADNIVLLQEDDEMAVKLMGLALPSRGAVESLSTPAQRFDFRSPEEIAGKEIDVRSGIFSLGALLYLMEAGPEKYTLFRAKVRENEAENPFAHDEEFSHRIGMVVKDAIYHDPKKRILTFAQLVDAIERARTSPEPSTIQPIVIGPRTDDVAGAQITPPTEISGPPEVAEKMPLTKIATKSTELRPGELMIPPELLKVAQPGRALRLNRVGVESREQVAVYVGNSFRIGRLGHLEIVTRFLPRNKANDTKSRGLSKTHITAKCKGKQILLLDGDGSGTKDSASANGSAFQTNALSPINPLSLVESGELRLYTIPPEAGNVGGPTAPHGAAGLQTRAPHATARNVYSIKVIPLLKEMNEVPVIANLSDWIGPIAESNPSPNGVIVFIPNERNEADVTLWLFSTATFGVGGVSSLDFTVPAEEPTIGALRYFHGCFWIEQKSTEALLVDELRLGIGEIAPLMTGQTIEVTGSKYAVDIQDSSKQQKG